VKLLPSLRGPAVRSSLSGFKACARIKKISPINQAINSLSHFSDKAIPSPSEYRGQMEIKLSPFHDRQFGKRSPVAKKQLLSHCFT
jgi:hypothetical protein